MERTEGTPREQRVETLATPIRNEMKETPKTDSKDTTIEMAVEYVFRVHLSNRVVGIRFLRKLTTQRDLLAAGRFNPQRFEPINNLMFVTIDCINLNFMRQQAVFNMIQDIFEALPVSECTLWFQFIEDNIDALGKIVVNAPAVRAFVGLMKRLSKTNDVIFCGRILMALSRVCFFLGLNVFIFLDNAFIR